MDIIPVIDVRHGVAVRALAGARESYRPLETPLAQGSDPVAVALGVRSLFPFQALYVADLDGIEGRGRNAELPGRLAAALPEAVLWIDDGSAEVPRAARRGLTPVIGSESLKGFSPEALASAARKEWVLSLDFRGDDFQGPAPLLDRPDLWPERVIVMTLARVGRSEGADLARIRRTAAKAADCRIYAAGGIRDYADLRAAQEAGAVGALIATALHQGTIKAGDLRDIAGL